MPIEEKQPRNLSSTAGTLISNGLSDPIEIPFDGCTVQVWPLKQQLRTLYKDGTEVEVRMNYYDHDLITQAEQLGYGKDVWAMLVDRELGYAVLSHLHGLPYITKHQRQALESGVMEMQRCFRLMTSVRRTLPFL